MFQNNMRLMRTPDADTTGGSTTLFQQLCIDAKKTLAGQNQGLIESGLKRRFMGTRDSALGNIDAHNQNINAELSKLNGMDLEYILELQQNIIDEQNVVTGVQGIYQTLFGAAMPSSI